MIDNVIATLQQGIELINALDDNCYQSDSKNQKNSSVGRHIRHIHDHFTAIQTGIGTGVVQYDQRIRGGAIETCRETGVEALQNTIVWLKSIAAESLMNRILVGQDFSSNGDDYSEYNSTIGRELLFVASHAVHHYALIKMRLLDLQLPAEFGVAPSTIRSECA